MLYLGHHDKVLTQAFRKPEGDNSGTQIFEFEFNFSKTSQSAKEIVDQSAKKLAIHVTSDVVENSLFIVIDSKHYNRLLNDINPKLLKTLKEKSDYLEHLLNVYSENKTLLAQPTESSVEKSALH